jgi:ABC-type multidrug transport system fused ATPase/permease subunit
MIKKTKITLFLIFKIIQDKKRFLFWFFIRFLSALLPLLTIFLYSQVIDQVERQVVFSSIFFLILLIFVVRLLDNFIRLKSIEGLNQCISNISFDIHNFFSHDIRAGNKEERNQTIQAIRNFADASTITLTLFRQPGVDSIVSLIIIPAILYFVDVRVLILFLSYILVYLIVDYYTTQRYVKLKDIQNTKIENYYSKFQESNDVELEQKAYTRHFARICNWSFIEWFSIQNVAVFFYSLILAYSIISVYSGNWQISNVVLVMGYAGSLQTYLNSFSEIKDNLADMTVAVDHLAKNKHISTIDLDDLI